MSDHVFVNKKKICFTEVSDFTDFQGVGSDPLYKRYESLNAVLRTCIDERYRGFLAEPHFKADEDIIEWYVEGWQEHPKRFTDLVGEERARYERIKDETVQHYRNAAHKLENEDLLILGGALKYIPDETIFCYDNKVSLVAWGMRYDTKKHQDVGSLMYAMPSKPKAPVYYHVRFSSEALGTLTGNGVYDLPEGATITVEMIPTVTAAEGYKFIGWDVDPLGKAVNKDMVFTAQYENCQTPPPVVEPPKNNEKIGEEKKEPQKFHNVQFMPGEFGKLKGTTSYSVPAGSMVTAAMIPTVKPKRRYKFVGWDVDPLASAVSKDVVFTAKYEKKKGWFAAVWPWLWKILLLLLLLLLLFLLLRNCRGCHRTPVVKPIEGIDTLDWVRDDPNVGHGGGIYDPGNPYTPVPTPPDYRDVLPPDQGVLPPIDDNDPIRRDPGQPVIIENRLNVLMENSDKSIMDLARDFKQKYPGDQYKVVYYDDVVKRMQIVVPSEEREAIKERLPGEFAPEYTLFVFDESMFEGSYTPSDPDMSNANKTWYLTAIGAFNAWDMSTGMESVTVAVVDNGFNLSHKEFKDKVVMPYNVWRHSPEISALSKDHGTHVAGTAIALANNGAGLCGIAPKCNFMPIQVADEQGRMTITSVLDGVLYAIYQGADVINISLGSNMPGVDHYPEHMQRDLIRNHFKEEERVWTEISRLAESHGVIIVAAAGNDNVLAGIDAMHRPKNIIIVSAVDKQNRHFDKARFSNYGEFSTVSAPGVDIYNAYGRGFRSLDGTSMASPIVAGTVALMKSLNKNITAEQVICVLQSTGKAVEGDIGPMIQLDKALLKVKNNQLDDCVQEENPVPSHGDVEITLSWNNINDLDLWCEDPSGEVIFYRNKHARSGGELEIDMNAGSSTSETPIEHIYWPTGGAPAGTYKVVVKYFKRRDQNKNETPYTVTMKYGNNRENYTDTVSTVNSMGEIHTFTLGNGSSNGAQRR